MPIPIICECGLRSTAPEALAGKMGRCRGCGRTMRIPSAPAPDDLYGLADVPRPARREDADSDLGAGRPRRTKASKPSTNAGNSKNLSPAMIVAISLLAVLGVLFEVWNMRRQGNREQPFQVVQDTPPIGVNRGPVATNGRTPGLLPKTLPEFRDQLPKIPIARDPSQRPSPIDEPPPDVFRKVTFPSAVGDLGTYITPDPKDGGKHPAIIWITGGDCNSIGDVWSEPEGSPDADQSARPFREAGIVMMFPSLRGGNDNPGIKEGFLGEVDDTLAAADYLETLPYVDPDRIYLGGHSTGGTLVLLTAACSDRFRAVFSFGPVADVRGYGGQFLPPGLNDPDQLRARSPGYWLDSVMSRTFVIEGAASPGNIDQLRLMAKTSKNPLLSFLEVKPGNHFNILPKVTRILAAHVLEDRDGEKSNITLSEAELDRAFRP